MKKMTFFLIVITITSGLVLSSFSKKKGTEKKKPFSPTTYYYISGTYYQRMEPNINTGAMVERSLMESVFKNPFNWTFLTVPFSSTSDYSKYIGSISFEAEATTDGGWDGQLTLQEAINAVWSAYASSNPRVMTGSYMVGTTFITVTAADAAH
jgi:hypothetical protein